MRFLRFIAVSSVILAFQAGPLAAKPCGGFRGLQCGSGQWCDFAAACGRADRFGTCRARPQACTRIYLPVCGCDGRTHPNACEAHSAGTDVMHKGACRD